MSSRNEHRAFEPPTSSKLSAGQEPGTVHLAHVWLEHSMLIEDGHALRVRSNCYGGEDARRRTRFGS